jgi:gas vesicle protein
MADLIGTEHQGATSTGQDSASEKVSARSRFDEAAASTKSLGEQAMSTGRDLADKAKDIAGSSTDAIKGQASDFVDAAKDMASQATDKLKDAVNDQKSAGAEYVGTLAETIRRAAREFDKDLPIAGTYIRKAASQIEGVSDQIRSGNLNDVVRNAQSFARRQPTAFLGLAVLAGFGAVRFLKSASDDAGPDEPAKQRRSSTADNRGYRDDFSN